MAKLFHLPAVMLLLASLLSLLTACGDKSHSYSPLPQGSPVVAFGDSVTHGVGAGHGEDYPARLAEISRWDIVNAGISGERADQATRRIDAVMAEYQPVLVLIELGGNDFLQRRSQQAVKSDLRHIIQQVRANGAIPVLIAVPELNPLRAASGMLKDAPLYAELAKEENIPLVASVFSDILSDSSLRADPIHPNADGYRRLAEGSARALSRYGLLSTP